LKQSERETNISLPRILDQKGTRSMPTTNGCHLKVEAPLISLTKTKSRSVIHTSDKCLSREPPAEILSGIEEGLKIKEPEEKTDRIYDPHRFGIR
jgi:hypothetical protein